MSVIVQVFRVDSVGVRAAAGTETVPAGARPQLAASSEGPAASPRPARTAAGKRGSTPLQGRKAVGSDLSEF